LTGTRVMGPGRSDAGSGVTTPLSHSQSSSNSYTMAFNEWNYLSSYAIHHS